MLYECIGWFFHVYIDDKVSWSNNLEEYQWHVDLVMQALCHLMEKNVNSSSLVQSSKCDKIMKWSIPWLATDVRSFLGLVRCIIAFLLKLANHTAMLMALTTRDVHKNFPVWTEEHNFSFESIKTLVFSVLNV